jgi:hypothetical protein
MLRHVDALRLRSPSLDENNVSIFDHVVLALRHHLSFRLDLIFVPKLFQYFVVEDYALDERLFKICDDEVSSRLPAKGSSTYQYE